MRLRPTHFDNQEMLRYRLSRRQGQAFQVTSSAVGGASHLKQLAEVVCQRGIESEKGDQHPVVHNRCMLRQKPAERVQLALSSSFQLASVKT